MLVSQTTTGFTRDWHDPLGWCSTDLVVEGGRIVGISQETGCRPSRFDPSPVYLGQVYRRLIGAADEATSLAPITGVELAALAGLLSR